MAAYSVFARASGLPLDEVSARELLRAAIAPDVGILLAGLPNVYRLKKTAPWTAADIAAAQIIIDTAPEPTPRLFAQHSIDTWPIEWRALVLALLDQINVVRSKLPVPLAAITPAQALQAIRNKAGTL